MSAISALKLRFAKQSDQIVPQPKAEEASTGRRKATEEQSKLLRNLLWNVEFDENRKAVLIDPGSLIRLCRISSSGLGSPTVTSSGSGWQRQ